MFSLIITIISIALAIALALATLYYGSTIYNNWKNTANAATLTNQASQIYAASQLYYNDNQRWPASIDVLKGAYLTSIPLPPNGALKTIVENVIATAYAQTTESTPEWTLVLDNKEILTYLAIKNIIAPDTCKAVQNTIGGQTSVFVNVSYTSAVQQIRGEVDSLIQSGDLVPSEYMPNYTGTDSQKDYLAHLRIIPASVDPSKLYQCVDQGLSISQSVENSAFTYFWLTPAAGNPCEAITNFNGASADSALGCNCPAGQHLETGACVCDGSNAAPVNGVCATVVNPENACPSGQYPDIDGVTCLCDGSGLPPNLGICPALGPNDIAVTQSLNLANGYVSDLIVTTIVVSNTSGWASVAFNLNSVLAGSPAAALGLEYLATCDAATNISNLCIVDTNTGEISLLLEPGTSQTIFKPFDLGTVNGSVSLTTSATNIPTDYADLTSANNSDTDSVVVTTGTAILQMGAYPAILVGDTATAGHTLLNNGSSGTVNLVSATISGTDSARFALTGNTCLSTLNAGDSCIISVSCNPTAATTFGAQLEALLDSGATVTGLLTCNGQAPTTGNVAITGSNSVTTVAPGNTVTTSYLISNLSTNLSAQVEVNWAVAETGVVLGTLPSGICASVTGGGTCLITGAGSASLTLPANSTVTITQAMPIVSGTGSIGTTGTITVSGLTDTNASDNTSSSTITVANSLLGHQVVSGIAHGCALTMTGGVKCWGGWVGAAVLGNDTITNSTTPVDVTGLTSGVVAIGGKANTTCAITTTGEAKCWGANNFNQIGYTAGTQQAPAVTVPTLTSGVVQIDSHYYHSCAVLDTGAVKCWGYNNAGQLGDGTKTNRSAPVTALASGAVEVAVGSYHTCARLSTGEVLCWGQNGLGAVGIGATAQVSTPTSTGITNAISISVGEAHSCAVLTDGIVKCWGYNAMGQLGDGTTTTRKTPVTVTATGYPMTKVGLGISSSCGVTTSGGIVCWGSSIVSCTNPDPWQEGMAKLTLASLTSGMATVVPGSNTSYTVSTSNEIIEMCKAN